MAKSAKPQYLKDDEKRIAAIRLLIQSGHIKTWQQIFDYIPRTVVATELGIANNRMKHLVADPSGITHIHLARMAAFLEVEFIVLSELAFKAMPVENRLKKKF